MINTLGVALLAWSGGMLVALVSMFYQARILNLKGSNDKVKLAKELAKEIKRAASYMLGAAIVLLFVGIGIIVCTFGR